MYGFSIVTTIIILVAIWYFRRSIQTTAITAEVVVENSGYIVAKSSDMAVSKLQEYAQDMGMEIPENENSTSYFHSKREERVAQVKALKTQAKSQAKDK